MLRNRGYNQRALAFISGLVPTIWYCVALFKKARTKS